ncbi:Signal transduction histidine kinase [Thiocapsa roseopersicina]|uniref:Signal transduction histidine kinase n=2 Tax=Thiocapsa roseopersicina TaxID=1058 RepID=A0A1H2QWX7_THIRO|nr:Signal transduction histidine kinase [Thiocapsa roseopersicina]
MDLLLCTAENAAMTTERDAPLQSTACDRRRAIRALLVIGLVWLSLVRGVVAEDNRADLLAPDERAWLDAHPRILLGVGAEWAPWVIPVGEGRIAGFAVDHLRLLGDKLGIEIGLKAGPWHEMVAAAEERRLDGLTLAAPLPERGDRFLFTEDFHTVHLFLYLRDGDPLPPPGLAGLNGRRVGYLQEVLRERKLLEGQASIEAVPLPSQAALAEALLTGAVDAAIGSYALEYWRASNGVLGFGPKRMLSEGPARLGISIRKDWPELVGILDKGLAAITAEESAVLNRRWFGRADVFSGGSVPTGLSADEKRWIADHPVLRVGIDPTWAPIEFFDEQRRPQGISVAYIRLIAERLGLRLEFVEARSWAAAVAQFHRRQLDLLPAVAATPSRRQRFDLTDPYVSFPAAIFAAADVAYLGGIEALQGKVVAVIESEAVHDWLREQEPKIQLLPVADTPAALRAVARGDAFAFVGNLAATSYYIGASGLTEIKVLGETPFVYRLGMAVHRDEPMLATILQKGLDAIPRYERDAIYNDWISIRYRVEADWGLLLRVAAGAALLLAIVGWWAFSLSREVQRRRRAEAALAELSRGLDQALAERTHELAGANIRLRRLAVDLSLSDEAARARLAGELHDSPMQKLALAQIQVESAARDPDDPETAELLGAGQALLSEAIAELRTLQFDLSPPLLARQGLAAALAWLAESTQARWGIRMTCALDPDLPQPGHEASVILFQCARELVYNLIKHARASRGTIRLQAREGCLELIVEDDGIGFDPNAPQPRPRPDGGFGLHSVRERLALIAGDLAVEPSAPGTRVRIRFPAD